MMSTWSDALFVAVSLVLDADVPLDPDGNEPTRSVTVTGGQIGASTTTHLPVVDGVYRWFTFCAR